MKLDRYDTLFVILLLASIVARIYLFDYPLAEGGGQGSRDYLVAHHIVQYHEFPLTGPNTLVHNYLSSPLYYYFIAPFVAVKDSLLFLAAVFVAFQIFTIVLIYAAAKTINPVTGLIASLLFSFSADTLLQSGNIWPNYAMQPFLGLSIFLLFLAYRKKSYVLVLLSLLVAAFAVALHPSALAVLPLLFAAALFTLKAQRATLKHYAGVLFPFLGSLLLFYAPPLLYLSRNELLGGVLSLLAGSGARGRVFVESLQEFLGNLMTSARALFEILPFSPHGFFPPSLTAALAVILLASALLYFFKGNGPGKKYSVFLLFFVLQQVFFVSLLAQSHTKVYLIPVAGLFAFFIAHIVNSVFSGHTLLRIGKIVLVVALLMAASGNFYLFSDNLAAQKNADIISLAGNVLAQKVKQIQRNEGFEDVDFFQIRSFRTGNVSVANEVLWVPLEEKMKRTFTKIEGQGARYKDLNSSEYIFLACYDHGASYDRNVCTDYFISLYKDYTIGKEIFSGEGLTIYETKRI